jgi:hypothetical protein
MHVKPTLPLSDHDTLPQRSGLESYIQFPEEENKLQKDGGLGRTSYTVIPEFLEHMKRAGPSTVGAAGRDGPSASDMILAL